MSDIVPHIPTRERFAAVYLRLSREDQHNGNESNSIASQRMQLMQYANQHNLCVGAEFSDDGVSGTQWQREGLQQLLRSVEEGWIDTVLVKDLSRLSRDYIRTGELMERWFPQHGVRLIAVDDGVDTAAASYSNDFSPFRAVMDDWYARDISRKVRAAIAARQQAGICTAASLPYGYYRRDGEVLIDCRKAEVVRQIFAYAAQGLNFCAIARLLNQSSIDSPGGGQHRWNDATVRRILQNTAYTGELRLHVTRKTSYKCSKKQYLPAHEALTCAVPPIISSTEYALVQLALQMRSRQPAEKHWLSGRVTCAECGSRMVISTSGNEIRLRCGGRHRGNCCRNPSLRYDSLLQDFQKEGLPTDERLLSRIVHHVDVSIDTITVKLNCAKIRMNSV